MRTSRKRYWGFGLIEILVTLGVLSVGILGVTVLHSTVTKQSSENKSRAEALAIAQSRIEDLRNYTGDVDSLAEFNTLFANTNGYSNSATITGTNASFTRDEQIGSSGDLKTLAVRVTWSDPDGDSQSVSLNTRLSYIPPRSIGDTALEAAASVVDAPTGRARLGEGTLPQNATTTSNSDGTSLYDSGGTDLALVSNNQIVLTLAEACQLENNTCIDFVRIKGRVYIDQTTRSSLNPGDVYVIASDAAFCARHYTANGTTSPVTAGQTNTVSTATGSYEYFDYTCYIGGGWHGNIGILLANGLANTDKICVGDPVTVDAWATPVLAARRVYRGMLYKMDDSTASGKEEISTNSGPMVRYYSQGIKDSQQLPVPNSGQKTHDFVIGSFNQNLTDGSNCETQGVMVRTDATISGVTGALFSNLPTDFICLNNGYLDTYDTNVFGHVSTCPYDPSDPPSTSHVISGSIRLDADDTNANDVIAATIASHTSDGPGNCTTTAANPAHDGTYYQFTYACDVYDWGNGWNGYIEADYDAAEMSCDPYQLNLTNKTANSANHNFTNCTTGYYAVITGIVTPTPSGNRKLSTASMGVNGACTIGPTGLTYECISTEYSSSTETRTFTITFTPTSGVMCKPSAPHSGVYTFTNYTSGNYTQNLKIAANTNGC